MVLPSLLCLLCLLSPGGDSSPRREGYHAVTLFKGSAIAVGTGGRIDCIAASGATVHIESHCLVDLRCVVAGAEMLIAAGNCGTILFSSDGSSFSLVRSGTDNNINGVASRNGVFVAGADGGTILTSGDGKSWNSVPLHIRGNVVSVAANPSFFIGVSDSGEILRSGDGRVWEIQDYNTGYAGYAPRATFKKIVASQSSIVIIGTHDDGSPSILTSTLGKVWAERPLIYRNEQGEIHFLTATPNDIAYDADRDQFVLACDRGGLLTLTSCPECSAYATIAETDLQALVYNDNTLVIVGDGYAVFRRGLY